MAKKIITDIVKTKRRIAPKPKEEQKEPLRPHSISRKKRGYPFKKIFFWVFVALVLFFALNLIISVFASASVRFTPKQEFVNIDLNLKAKRGSQNGDVSFEIVKIEHEEGEFINSTGTKDVSKKASGEIVIYNAFSSSRQTLVKNTRFETPDGKIYRIDRQVSVPGTEVKEGKIVPGSLEVTVYADKPGEEYNIGLTDFTIPGFKGSQRYEKFYARSKTEITGGFVGTLPIFSEEDAENARLRLRENIKDYFAENVSKQRPEGYLLYDNGLIIDFYDSEENPEEDIEGGSFYFNQKGVAIGILIEEDKLSEEIVRRYLNDDIASGVRVANIKGLDFKITEKDSEYSSITFNLKGRAHLVWKVDTGALALDFAEAEDRNYGAIFKRYPAIEEAEIVFKPPWWRKIPLKPSKIRFEEVLKD